jgi:hypothetical protein
MLVSCNMKPPSGKLLTYLAKYDPHISNLTLALRKIVLDEAPEALEYVIQTYAVSISFSFTGKPLKDGFCHIVTYADHVNLGFNHGAQLPDPRKLLKGTGKQIRHLTITQLPDLDSPHLTKFLRAAIDQIQSR